MAKTFLTLAQDVARDSGVDLPTQIFGINNNTTNNRLRSALQDSIEDLASRYDWQILVTTHSFSTVASQDSYDVPSDFDRIINQTMWNDTNKIPISEATPPQDWRGFVVWNAGSARYQYARFKEDKVFIYPTPTAVETVSYEYITNLLVLDNVSVAKETWTADDDTTILNDLLVKLNAKWRFLRYQGRPYSEEKNEFEEHYLRKMGRDGGRRVISNHNNLAAGKIAWPTTVSAPTP